MRICVSKKYLHRLHIFLLRLQIGVNLSAPSVTFNLQVQILTQFSSFQLIGQYHVNHKFNNPIREQMVWLSEWSLTELQVLEG